MESIFKCPICDMESISSSEYKEQSIITCKNHIENPNDCKYTYVCCPSSSKHKIFFKIPSNACYYTKAPEEKVDFYVGINIKCPYDECGEFFMTRCSLCKKENKIEKRIQETEPITCPVPKCGHSYFHFKYPYLDEPQPNTFKKPDQYKNFPDGITFSLKGKATFQKINCVACYRPIVFFKGKYFECQSITCPYPNCQKEFNRTICPKCFCENNFIRTRKQLPSSSSLLSESMTNSISCRFNNSGEYYYSGPRYIMGSKVICHNCGEQYSKLFCYACQSTSVVTKDLEGLFLSCGFEKCGKSFQFINCIFCYRMNVFPSQDRIPSDKSNLSFQGKLDTREGIKCGYADCGKTFHKISCPHCKKFNLFPNNEFIYGKKYSCQYFYCRKYFVVYYCPECKHGLTTVGGKEGWKIICGKCDTCLANWKCCFCEKNIIDKNSKLQSAQMIRCPNKQCLKVYSFVSCMNCKSIIYSKENESLEGTIADCPNCREKFALIRCVHCSTLILTLNKTEVNMNEDKTCKNCGQSFKPKDSINKTIYESKDMTVLEPVTGTAINIGTPETDVHEVELENSFIKCNQYNECSTICSVGHSVNQFAHVASKGEKTCIICQSGPGESVFIPCGHRCVCYNCAVMQLNTFKACPCGKFARGIIKKIFD
jgi:hypothetical protein